MRSNMDAESQFINMRDQRDAINTDFVAAINCNRELNELLVKACKKLEWEIGWGEEDADLQKFYDNHLKEIEKKELEQVKKFVGGLDKETIRMIKKHIDSFCA